MSSKFTQILSASAIVLSFGSQAQLVNIPELHEENQTFMYPDLIRHYEALDAASDHAVLIELGVSDAGFPIHALVIADEPVHAGNVDAMRESRYVLAVNNGIHPGESCGVDASLHLVNRWLTHPEDLNDVMLVVVPMYNIGGALNRSCCTRANQNGPESQGFRGNARNYDLNRDLIKADTRNTFALYELFNRFDPEIFIDTHSTNGADYPYEMTLITSPWQKYPEALQPMVREADSLMYKKMEERHVPMSPYVNVFGRAPDDGFELFKEGAIYTTGYAALTGAVAFVTEAHMLKPYGVRVHATYEFIEGAIELTQWKGGRIREAKQKARSEEFKQYSIDWNVDTGHFDILHFRAFEHGMKTSEVTGATRLYYSDEEKEMDIPYYNRLTASRTVDVPEVYYVPVGQWDILTRLKAAGVRMDTLVHLPELELMVEQPVVDRYTYAGYVYEGHHLFSDFQWHSELTYLPAGSYVEVSTNQPMGRYIVEALHPDGPGSFVRWDFFSIRFQQKEHYSAYVFEDTAAEMMRNNEELRDRFENRLSNDPEFKASPEAQLDFIYKNSPYYEDAHMRLPYYYSVTAESGK